MKVILLQDIKSLGRRGDIKDVADGYARNFLLPKKSVKPATPTAIQELEVQKVKLEKQLEELRTELEEVERATAAEPLTFEVKVGEKGEVFGSVVAREIKEKLIEKFPKLQSVDLEIQVDHIRELGRQEIDISLDRGLKGKIVIEVLPIPRLSAVSHASETQPQQP